MARKIKDFNGLFATLRKLYEEIKDDNPKPRLLEDMDGDRRILAHAIFYIASKKLAKKLDGLETFELLRLLEERMLHVFITDPNSERVDQLLEKADLVYELLPYIVLRYSVGDRDDEASSFSREILYQTYGLLSATMEYASATEEDALDRMLDSLSLRTGQPGSPIIESETPEIMEGAMAIVYGIKDKIEDNEDDTD